MLVGGSMKIGILKTFKRRHSVKFSIRKKIILLFLLSIVTLILLLSISIGWKVRAENINRFNETIHQDIQLVEQTINVFFDNTKNMLEVLSKDVSVRSADENFNQYITKTTISNTQTIKKNEIEQRVFNLFQDVNTSYPDYLCVFMGTKWGGYVSTSDVKLAAGYDHRERPWYKDALGANGKVIVTSAYLSTLGESVVCLSREIFSQSNEPIGAVSIEFSLKNLKIY